MLSSESRATSKWLRIPDVTTSNREPSSRIETIPPPSSVMLLPSLPIARGIPLSPTET